MKKTILNTAALTALLGLSKPRLDGTEPDPKPSGDERQLTAKEWGELERSKAAQKSTTDLIDELVKVKGENYSLRRKQAPEGGVVLDAEQAKRWQSWEALGKPEEVTASLAQGKKDRAAVEQAEKRQTLSTVAEAAGWDADAFADLDAMAGGLEWTVKEVKGSDGNSVKSVTVKQDGKDVDAAEFAKQRWSKFLPVLAKTTEEAEVVETVPPVVVRIPTGGAGGAAGRPYSVQEAEKRKAESGAYDM